jgi:Leucine-rich repeat (LRR) protein
MSDGSKKPKRKRRWGQFSLRTFLVVTIALGIWLGWYVHRANQQASAVKWIEENGGVVSYDYQFEYHNDKKIFLDVEKPPGPVWLHNILGVHYFATVVEVDLSSQPIDDVEPLGSLTSLKQLNLYDTNVHDIGPLAALTGLTKLNLNHTSVRNIEPLKNMRQLKTLHMQRSEIDDLTPLQTLQDLEFLNVMQTNVSDLTPLADHTKLRVLYLHLTLVSEWEVLANLTSLTSLYIAGTKLSETDIEKLKRALPNCTIYDK